MAKCKRSFLWNLSSWKETSGNEEHLCKLRLRPFSWLVHEPSRTQFVQCPMQLRNGRGEDQRICSLALPGSISCLSLPSQDSVPKLSLAKLWQSRKILLCSLVVRGATRINNPRSVRFDPAVLFDVLCFLSGRAILVGRQIARINKGD